MAKTVSFSRLGVYEECSYLYKLAYIENLIDRSQDTEATRIGNYCHESLENFYGDEAGVIESPYQELVRDGGIWDRSLAKDQLSELRPQLQEYTHHTTSLYYRASAAYKGKDAIRKSDGTVAAAPHMTGAWKEYAKKHGLDSLAASIDRKAAAATERWKGVKLSQVYAESLGIMYPYQHPAAIDRVVSIEFPISEVVYQAADAEGNPLLDVDGTPVQTTRNRGPHPVYFNKQGKPTFLGVTNAYWLPALESGGKLTASQQDYLRRDDVLLTGYIDLIARDKEGRLLIIDHKTNSGEVPSPNKVARHEQMLIYGFVVATASGEVPHAIGMNHLRSNRLILAPFSMEAAEQAVERFLSIYTAVEKEVFIKQAVDGYHSRCVVKARNAGDAPKLCPGLSICHPAVYESLAL